MPSDAAESSPTSALPRHIPSLDGLRAIAILAVLAYHASVGARADGPIAAWTLTLAGGGWMGVDLFFVLSGFLITGILLETRGAEGYYRTFMVRRALRILPLYYVTVLLLVAGSTLLTGTGAVEGATLRGAQEWYWTHLVNVLVVRGGFSAASLHTGHFWSLALEEQFYLVWPLVVALCPPDRLRRLCVILIGGALAVRIGLFLDAGTGWLMSSYVLPFARLDTLALGAWLAVVARQPGGLPAVWPSVRRLGALGAGVLVLVAALAGTLQWGPWPMQTVGYTAVALVAAAMLVLAIRSTGPMSSLLRSRPLQHIGRRSYALYVLHSPLIAFAEYAGASRDGIGAAVGSQLAGLLIWAVALLAVTLVLAECSWMAIERPCLALKDRIAARPSSATDRHPDDTDAEGSRRAA